MSNINNTPFQRFQRVTAHICMAKDIGINGNLFGGNMLAWMDEACAIFAREETGEKYIVTKLFNEIEFRRPVHEGDLVIFECGNVTRGKTSIQFNIRVKIGEEIVFNTSCVFVAVDNNGNKKEIDWK